MEIGVSYSGGGGFELFDASTVSPQGWSFALGTNSTAAVATTGSAVPAGAWQFVVGTWGAASGTLTTYVNGTAASSVPLAGSSIAAGPNDVAIGYDPSYGGDYLYGTIAQAMVLDYALTPAEITTLYQDSGAAAPSVSSSATIDFSEQESGSFTVTTSGPGVASLSETGVLPAGITFVDDGNGTATLSGTPTGTAGTYPITITATNAYGSTTQDATIITSTASASSTSGDASSWTAPINPGTLSFVTTPPNLTFPALVLDGSDQTTSTSLPLDVGDNTGSGAGWNVTITSTQFSDGSATLPASATSVNTAPSASCDPSSSCTPATLSSSDTYPVTIPAGSTAPTATRLYSAAAGSGMGDQSFPPTFTLAVPANTAAGAYSSDWTLSLVSGP